MTKPIALSPRTFVGNETAFAEWIDEILIDSVRKLETDLVLAFAAGEIDDGDAISAIVEGARRAHMTARVDMLHAFRVAVKASRPQ